MGALGVEFVLDEVQSLSREDIINVASKAVNMSPEQLQRLSGRIQTVFGQAADLTATDWQEIGQFAKALSTGNLAMVNEPAIKHLKQAAAKYELTTCPAEPPSCQTRATLPLVDVDFCPEQWKVIGGRLLALFGEAGGWDKSTWENVGTLARGLSPADFGDLTLEGIDAVASVTCMPLDRLECLVKRATTLFNDGKGIVTWGRAEIERLGNGLAGLSPTALKNMTKETFAAAVDLLREEPRWNLAQRYVLGDKSVEAFGDPSTWGEDVVEMLGPLVAGMKDQDLAVIAPVAMASMAAPAVQTLCDTKKLTVLTSEQLGELADRMSCPAQEAFFSMSQSKTVQDRRSPPPAESKKSDSNTAGVVAGVVVSLVVVIALVAAFVLYKR